MGRLRQLFESVVYAGMKPQAPGGAPANPVSGWRQQFDRWLNGPAPTDPLYLSNRTTWQRVRVAVVVVAPVLLLLAVLALALGGAFKGTDAPKPKELTVAEKAARILPDLNKPIRLPANRDLEVEDVHIERGSPTRLAGLIKNNTGRMIAAAELSFDLTDNRGSRLGAVSTRVEKLPPHSTTSFRFPIAQDTAELVLVREYQIQ